MTILYKGRKAAVITLGGRFNYGNRLQNHATVMLLESRGLEVETIVYPKTFKKRAMESLKHFCGRAGNPEDLMSDDRKKRFSDFDRGMAFKNVSRPSEVSEGYDLIAIGSDQVWNPNFANLRFTLGIHYPAHKIMTVSPSFGISSLPKKAERAYTSALTRIPELTVREPAGSLLAESLTGNPALVTPDPTLAVDSDIWRNLAVDDLTPDTPYVLAYVLGRLDESQRMAISQACDAYGAKPVFLVINKGVSDVDPGPAEFISLIDCAACVVTDSFHASAFSVMLHTPLVILRRNESSSSFARLQNLIDMFRLSGVVYNGDIDVKNPTELYRVADHELELQKDVLFKHLDTGLRRALG